MEAPRVPKVLQNPPKTLPGATLVIFEKVWFYLSKTMVFEGPGGPKNAKNQKKTGLKNTLKFKRFFLAKNQKKSNFRVPFGLQNAPFGRPGEVN